MSLPANVNDRAILRGVFHLPAEGLWTAIIALDGEDELPTTARAVRVTLPGDVELVGTVKESSTGEKRQGVVAGLFTAELVGGGAGLPRSLPAKFYKGVPLRIPLLDLLTEAGELLAASADADILTVNLPAWTRAAGVASDVRRELLAAAASVAGTTLTWRALPDGSIWFGRESWPVADVAHDLVSDDGLGCAVVALGEGEALVPPVTFRDRKVRQVVYRIDGPTLRTEVWS